MEVMENIRLVLIKNIKTNRKRLGINQDQLAERSRLSTGMIKLIESGKRWPSPATIEAIADGLGITVSELFEGPSEGRVLNFSMSLVVKKMLSIPDDIYEMAEVIGPEHSAWQFIRGAYDQKIKSNKAKASKDKQA